ncbi:hypothetical protein [Nocardia transvalensis]|uniref:hypothetical protein n=1 Tax=Nocardia transvalensis TaxID=37333 RepID=UPI001894C46C|nr:hypothetical protein [Nocardia transvalensis]MBF6333650.1 hypothetical protein [Nocardia transvalensis]
MPTFDPQPPLGGGTGGIPIIGRLIPHLSWSDGSAMHALTVFGVCLLVTGLMVTILLAAAARLAWPPARMRNFTIAAVAALPGISMVLAWSPTGPVDEFRAGATDLLSGHAPSAVASMSVLLIPVAWLVAMLMHTDRVVTSKTTGFRSLLRTEQFKDSWVQRQREAAARWARYPVATTTGGLNPHLVLGRLAVEEFAAPPPSRTRALLQHFRSVLVVPWRATREHMVLVANTGSGKTTLLLRALVSWYVTAWLRHRQWWRRPRTGRPLAVLVNCKGGPGARRVTALVVKWFRALGLRDDRIGILGEGTNLNLWAADPADIISVLLSMISGGLVPATENERYFHNMRKTLIRLIVTAPAKVENGKPIGCNPPRSSEEFLARFDKDVLALLWGADYWDPDLAWTGVPGVDLEIQSTLDGEQPVMTSARSEFGDLFYALDGAFDGDADIGSFDLLICNLEGTTHPDRARAQFNALGCLFEQLTGHDHGRETFLAVEEFSAVSDQKTRADKWVHRFREALIGTLWIAQDWFGLGADDDQRQSLVVAAGGGALLGRQEKGDRLCDLFGPARRFEVTRARGRRGHTDGTVTAHEPLLVEPNRLRRLKTGDVVHVGGGRARFGHVTPLNDADLARLRPLPGIDRFTHIRRPAAALAPVIDLRKHRRSR